jgi:hypothetical protein
MPKPANVPSLEQRVSALREIFPILPLSEPQALFTRKGRGESVVPRLYYQISGNGNIDASARVAQMLGTTQALVDAEYGFVDDAPSVDARLVTREILEGLTPPERILEFPEFALHNDSDGAPTALWWYLMLPVLTPELDTAFASAQLNGKFGAEDFWWIAKKAGGGWTVEAVPSR